MLTFLTNVFIRVYVKREGDRTEGEVRVEFAFWIILIFAIITITGHFFYCATELQTQYQFIKVHLNKHGEYLEYKKQLNPFKRRGK